MQRNSLTSVAARVVLAAIFSWIASGVAVPAAAQDLVQGGIVPEGIGAGGLGSLGNANEATPDGLGWIRIAAFDWSSSGLTATILQKLLTRNGYRAQIVAASTLRGAVDDLATGRITIGLEYRQTGIVDNPAELGRIDGVENLGVLGPISRQIWWYPDYVADLCPGLPDWHALKKCGEVFAIPQSGRRGILLSGPVGWGFDEARRVAALDLPFDVVNVSVDRTINEQVQMAISEKRPILISLVLPNWVPDSLRGRAVILPDWEPACDMVLSWGSNPGRTHDCAGPVAQISKLAWSEMKVKWPGAYRIARKLQFEPQEFNQMLYEIEWEHKPVGVVAEAWIERHQSEVVGWRNED